MFHRPPRFRLASEIDRDEAVTALPIVQVMLQGLPIAPSYAICSARSRFGMTLYPRSLGLARSRETDNSARPDPFLSSRCNVSDPNTTACVKARSRRCNAFDEAGIVLQPVVEPIVLGLESDENSGCLPVTSDDDLLGFRHSEVPG